MEAAADALLGMWLLADRARGKHLIVSASEH